jgi:hypothetical protein
VSWNEHHSISEKLAIEAETASRVGETSRAQNLYRQAAAEEAAAFEDLRDDKLRTRGITAVSAAALWYKGRDYLTAELLAHRYLTLSSLPQFAVSQLRHLLQAIWTSSAAEQAGVKFISGDVLVSVSGGQVIEGGAPLELIVRKVENIQSVLFRTVEMLLERPFRKRGGPPLDIQSMFRPWLFQAPPGSYQFAVRMQEPPQGELFPIDRPKIENVTATFFRVLRATSTNPETELPTTVPDPQYRAAFLKLSRDLTPTGKTFDRLEVRDASSPSEPSVTFALTSRQELNSELRKLRPPSTVEEQQIHGVLRGLHLDRDWLEVTTITPIGTEENVRINDANEVLDDVVGPMVNKRVVVTAVRRGTRYFYRDIEIEE